MLSQTSEYALRAMVWLASQSQKDFHLSNVKDFHFYNVTEIAAATGVPLSYLSKILQTLNRAFLLQKKRGVKGGYCLKSPPEQITLLSIVENFDKIERILTCPLKLKEHAESLCPLHSELDKMACSLLSSFSKRTLKDLISRPDGALCKL